MQRSGFVLFDSNAAIEKISKIELRYRVTPFCQR
jgi:hypothetical protein